ncbi:MAG: beta-ketoacyl-ACP synthase II [Spirochaetales bacterium]
MSKRRVVVTGIGTVNPLGNSVEQSWNTVIRGQSGIGPITRFDASHLPTQIAGEVREFDYRDYFEGDMAKKAKRMDNFCHYAVAAAREAAEQADLSSLDNRQRIGVGLGSGIGGLNVQYENSVALENKGPRRVSPFYIPMSIGNMASGILSIVYGATGPNISMQTACATANHSIAMSQMIISNNMADVMIAGGAESTINEISVVAFGNMRALSTRNDAPGRASRPYDRDRDGFVLSEGAAVLILEEYEHAKRRGAPILCEVLACGMSGDAYDFVAPDPEGRGADYAMRMALEQAEISASDIDYVNTHGTSTPVGDRAELLGVRSVFGEGEERPYVGSTKGYHGHLLGATAGIEAILTICAMRDGIVPANINIETPDHDMPKVKLPTENVKTEVRTALSNSFGFGGHNSSLVLRAL